jgi:pectate lyase
MKKFNLTPIFAVILGFSGSAFGLPAFPGAEGFGAATPGGRGGRVIEVTNLNDSGAGSFREAVMAKDPRIVVFRVSGTIAVKSKISVKSPFLTVAGQSAPGGGITIKNDPSYGGMPLNIAAHDVVIRYLRIRPGAPQSKSTDKGNLDATDLSSYNTIIDHCSFSWATDEVFTFGGGHDSTIQWSIIAEGLDHATNPKGAHSKGLHLREGNTPNISVHHTLLAHNYDRNPNINTSGTVEFVNNVVYDATRWTEVKDKFGEPHVNIVNNYYKLGPSSGKDSYEVFYYDSKGKNPRVYVKGNIGFHRTSDNLPEENIVRPDSRWMIVNSPFQTTTPTSVSITASSAVDAYNQVLASANPQGPFTPSKAGAGASLGLDSSGAWRWTRDANDTRVTSDVRNYSGYLIDSAMDSRVGGYSMMARGTEVADTDHDGMPDAWEHAHGFNPDNSSDSSTDADGDGYTNVEEYLNSTNPGAKG